MNSVQYVIQERYPDGTEPENNRDRERGEGENNDSCKINQLERQMWGFLYLNGDIKTSN